MTTITGFASTAATISSSCSEIGSTGGPDGDGDGDGISEGTVVLGFSFFFLATGLRRGQADGRRLSKFNRAWFGRVYSSPCSLMWAGPIPRSKKIFKKFILYS
uniref:Predicted protein n=1 Tax=Hordeum vulgare subsp. vulgare TaxID=112509 RepID=F2DL67_HORVV|nr:predicted protein [Hordeum vulgare subsp. vulgare]